MNFQVHSINVKTLREQINFGNIHDLRKNRKSRTPHFNQRYTGSCLGAIFSKCHISEQVTWLSFKCSCGNAVSLCFLYSNKHGCQAHDH